MLVVVDGCSSSCRGVASGVPQGSVLGPVLFLIYINHMASSLNCQYKIFADDLKIYMTIQSNNVSSALNCIALFQQNILNGMAKSWGLHLHPDKCVALRFSRDLPPVGLYDKYFIDDSPIPFTNQSKDLGVMIDTSLKFHNHIRFMASKAGGMASNLLKSSVSFS